MKVVTRYDEGEYYGEYRDGYEIEVDGEVEIAVGMPEPEDCTLSRDLGFAFSIVPLMKRAWEAGKNGEEFTAVAESTKE